MRISLLFTLLFSICCFHTLNAQDSIISDSVTTPFRKGRWLTGISGIISSSRVDVKSEDDNNTSNEYGISISGGNFIADRWLIGGIIQFDKADADGLTDLSNEILFIGPLATRYLSDADRGALFISLSPGYTRYRNFIRFSEELSETTEQSEGSGFGLVISLGYSYVIFDRITFDIGFNITQRWLNVERTQTPGDIVFSDDINLRDISFSFGFRVLLDKFLQ